MYDSNTYVNVSGRWKEPDMEYFKFKFRQTVTTNKMMKTRQEEIAAAKCDQFMLDWATDEAKPKSICTH